MNVVSIFDNEKHSKRGMSIDFDSVLDQIRTEKHKQIVDEIKLLKYNFKIEQQRCSLLTKEQIQLDEKYQKAKNLLREAKGRINRVTVSGKFGDSRSEKDLQQHSGLIDIDIDGLEYQELIDLKHKFMMDRYCYATFVTCGGDGLAFIAKIDGKRHKDAWDGLQQYFFATYGISIDPAHKNPANTRNLSSDRDIFIADGKVEVFRDYPKRKKEKKIVNKFVFSRTDFGDIISEIIKRRIDFCPSNDYETYRDMGFAIGSKFGDDGLSYFDAICSFAECYSQKNVERDYKWFCKNPNGGKTIASFYARCKEFNIEISSKKTARIATVASASLKGGKTKEDTVANLVKFEGFTKEDCEDIVNQVFDEKIEFNDEKSILDEIEAYIMHNYSLMKNEVTGKLENDGVEWSEEDLNALYISIKKVYDKADPKWIERIIFSPFVKKYHPLQEWFKSNEDKQPDELLDDMEIPSIIKRLWGSIKTDNQAYLEKFGTKWLVSCVSSAFGQASNLELDFAGGIGHGKSYFFKNILPKELSKYFAECSFSKESDDEVLMCLKWIILNDECGGKTRNDEKKHKRLLDKDIFSIRRPYRKDLEDLVRLAVLCGTSNPLNLQSDASGNRRVIYVNVLSRDQDAYDSIDKTELWMAAYYLWEKGYNWKILGDEIKELNANTQKFNAFTLEYELVNKHIVKSSDIYDLMTASDIKVAIYQKTGQNLSLSKINDEIRRLGFSQVFTTLDGVDSLSYNCKERDVVTQKKFDDIF